LQSLSGHAHMFSSKGKRQVQPPKPRPKSRNAIG
jgi:hypothetical protein